MRFVALLAIVGCGSDPVVEPEAPVRERDVIVGLPRGLGSVIYREPDTAWQLATKLDEQRYGFDVESDRYVVAVVCADEFDQTVDVVFSTLAEQVDHVFVPPCGRPPDPDIVFVRGMLRTVNVGGYAVNGRGPGDRGFGEAASYEMAASAVPQSLVFATLDEQALVSSYVFHRDVVLVDDRVIDVDFARGVPARRNTLQLANELSFFAQFVTGDGVIVPLQSVQPLPFEPFDYTTPPEELWRAGDHVVLQVESPGGFDVFARVTIRAFELDELPDLVDPLFAPGGNSEVFESLQGIIGRWTGYSDATSYHAVLLTQTFPDGLDCAPSGFCDPVWDVRVSPASRLDIGPDLVIVPDPAELAALGVWDERLALGADFFWTASVVSEIGNRTYEGGRSGLIGGDIEDVQ